MDAATKFRRRKGWIMLKFRTLGIAAGIAAATMGISLAAQSHGVDKSKQVTHIPGAAGKNIKSMNEPGVKAFFEDVVSSNDPKAPITCAMFRIEKSEPLKYTYDYDDTKIVLDGEITVNDGTTSYTARKGDALLLPKGSSVTFTSASSGTAWACGQRPAS
jgi:ethanolamine utilization protein EutQ (cupin superfamily)